MLLARPRKKILLGELAFPDPNVGSALNMNDLFRIVREITVSFVCPSPNLSPAGRGDIGQLFLERSLATGLVP